MFKKFLIWLLGEPDRQRGLSAGFVEKLQQEEALSMKVIRNNEVQ